MRRNTFLSRRTPAFYADVPGINNAFLSDFQFNGSPVNCPVETELVKNITVNGTTEDNGHFSKVTVNVNVADAVPVVDRVICNGTTVLFSQFTLASVNYGVSPNIGEVLLIVSPSVSGFRKIQVFEVKVSGVNSFTQPLIGDHYYVFSSTFQQKWIYFANSSKQFFAIQDVIVDNYCNQCQIGEEMVLFDF